MKTLLSDEIGDVVGDVRVLDEVYVLPPFASYTTAY